MTARFDVPANTTLYIPFTSYDAAGASVTLSGLAATDIEIYKNGSTTQRASDAGYALLDTDGTDFDGITGLHGFSVDLSDNTTSGFYEVGAQYWVVVSAVTIDSQTVSFVAAWFRIVAAEAVAGKPKVDVDAWLGTAAATPTVAGVPEVDVTHFGGSAATAASGIPAVNTTQIEGSDATDQIRDAVVDDATRIDASALNTATGTTIPAILDDTDLIDDGTSGLAKIATDVAAILVDTGTTLDDKINTIDSNVDDILTDTGTTLPGLIGTPTDLGGGATLAANNVDMAGATFATSTDSQEAIRNRGDAAWTTATGFSTHSASDVWAAGTRTLTALDEDDTTIDLDATIAAAVPAASAIADAVWDEDATGHQTGGTFGQAIGDPGANTETIYDAVVTDAAGTNVAADIIAVKAETASILTDTAEIGAAGAGLTEAGGTGDHLTAINLPNQTMDITGNITGNLSGSVGSVTALASDSITAAALAADAGAEIADAILNRDMSTGTDSGSTTVRTPRQALRFLRNKWSISDTTLTVTKEDDSTASWTTELTTSGSADPVVGSDPAGP